MTPPVRGFGEITTENAGEVLKRKEFKYLTLQELQYLLAEKEKNQIMSGFEEKLHKEKSDETWAIKTEKVKQKWDATKQEFEPEKEVTIKINPEGDIKEYISGVPKGVVGIQLFSIRALQRLGLLDRLPANFSVIEKMIDKAEGKIENERYHNFLNNNKGLFIQVYSDGEREPHCFNDGVCIFLADGKRVVFTNEGYFLNENNNKDCLCPVWLIKNV